MNRIWFQGFQPFHEVQKIVESLELLEQLEPSDLQIQRIRREQLFHSNFFLG